MNAEACLGARVDPCGTGPGQARAGNRPQGQSSTKADGPGSETRSAQCCGVLLLVVTDSAVDVAHSRDVTHLRNGLWIAWPWKFVANLGELTFRLLTRGKELLPICF